MKYLLMKTKLTHGRVWLLNYLWKQFQRLECDRMKSRSTGRLAVSDLDYTLNTSELGKEVSCPTPVPLDNMVSLLFNILERG